MVYTVQFLEEAAKDWHQLDPSVRNRLKKAIDRLRTAPSQYGKPLGGPLHGLRRLRNGDFRIVYLVKEADRTVEIAVVCHRRDVYGIALQRGLI